MFYLQTGTASEDSKCLFIQNSALPLSIGSGMVDSLYHGLLFWAPLSENKGTAETGQAFALNGSLLYQEHYGIPCLNGDFVSGLFCSDTDFPFDREPCSMSIWVCKADDFDSTLWNSFLCYGNQNEEYKNRCIMSSANDNFLGAGGNGEAMIGTTPLPDRQWIHCIATFVPDGTGMLVSLYLNGKLDSSGRVENLSTEGSVVRLMPRGVYLAGARIYNRILSEAEIRRLAEEYSPLIPRYPRKLTSLTSDPEWEIIKSISFPNTVWTVFDGSNRAGPFDGPSSIEVQVFLIFLRWTRTDQVPFHASFVVLKTNEDSIVEDAFTTVGLLGLKGYLYLYACSSSEEMTQIAVLDSSTPVENGQVVIPVDPSLEIIGFQISAFMEKVTQSGWERTTIKINISGIEAY